MLLTTWIGSALDGVGTMNPPDYVKSVFGCTSASSSSSFSSGRSSSSSAAVPMSSPLAAINEYSYARLHSGSFPNNMGSQPNLMASAAAPAFTAPMETEEDDEDEEMKVESNNPFAKP